MLFGTAVGVLSSGCNRFAGSTLAYVSRTRANPSGVERTLVSALSGFVSNLVEHRLPDLNKIVGGLDIPSEDRPYPLQRMARRASRPGMTQMALSSPKGFGQVRSISGQSIRREVRPTGDDVGPDLAVTRDRFRGGTTLTFRGGAVTMGKRFRAQPGLERLVAWKDSSSRHRGDHQPLIPVVGRLQQFVTLESVLQLLCIRGNQSAL
jgi:hypothetical protein